ncbi:hypothetical protein Btru_073995 [Bulinus truncatus]|nr:hypothetical protein Btru_073995 [Bulinus truncatus]
MSTYKSESQPEYQESEDSEEQSASNSKNYIKTKTATKLVASSKLTTSKAAIICRQLSQNGINIQTPSQSEKNTEIFDNTCTNVTMLDDHVNDDNTFTCSRDLFYVITVT